MRRYGKDADEEDVRVRPGRKGSRPRTSIRPKHEDAAEGFVLTVDRGRITCLVGERQITAMKARELNALGSDVKELPDGLRIRPRPLHGGVFHTYEDHRLATAAAVLGLAVEGVQVENVATTGKTLPDFPGLWTGMLAGTGA